MTGMNEAPAALERGRPVMVVTPPAVEQAEAVWELLKPSAPPVEATTPQVPRAVIVCADVTSAEDWADTAPPARRVHPVTALERTARLLREGTVDVLAGAPEELQALATRAALKLDAVPVIVLAWPEWLQASGREAALEQLLGESRTARRIVLAWNPAALEDLLERHARRPHVVGDLPLGEAGRPLPPVGPARYAVMPRARRQAGLREVLDALDRPHVAEWRLGRSLDPEPADAVVCLDLPTRAELAAISAVGVPVLLLAANQLPYARGIAQPLTALSLPGARARARARADRLRSEAAARIEAGGLEAELALLEPLLSRYDAAEVAAAILALGPRPPGIGNEQPTADRREAGAAQAWVRLFLDVGRKDRVGPKDLVGALTREIGVPREALGRIEVRDTHSLVSVSAEVADRALAGLGRVTIRGRRVAARRDRER